MKLIKVTDKNGTHKGYKSEEQEDKEPVISVHGHIHDPESWLLTIRKAEIFRHRLCSKDCSEYEITAFIKARLNAKITDLNYVKSLL